MGVRHEPIARCAQPCPAERLQTNTTRALSASLPSARELAGLAEFFAILANPTRLKLILALSPRPTFPTPELCVCDLAAIAGSSVSMASHQFRLLRQAGLVSFRRDGKLVLYRLANGPRRRLLATALEYLQS